MSSSWEWDYASNKYVGWDGRRGCWVDEHDRQAREPQRAPNVAPGRSSAATLEASLGNLNIGTSTANTSPDRPAQSDRAAVGAAVVGAYTTTVKDKKTGAETIWEVSASRQYRDPNNADATRTLNVKHIRQQKNAKSIAGYYTPSTQPSRDYKLGRIIEVALVPPDPGGTRSTVSHITPSPFAESTLGRGVRLRRFVICQENPEGRNSFKALAIKTYNGSGVAAQNVVKAHHVIIYTARSPPVGPGPPPQPASDEQPQRNSKGQIEGGMYPTSILAEAYDRTKALDPKARLDYMSSYEFDYGVANIKLWGRISEQSQPTFFSQYNHCWATVYGQTSNPGPGARYPPPPSESGTSVTVVPSAPGTGLAEPPGIISEGQMLELLGRSQQYARDNGLTVPGRNLTTQQLHSLAVNPTARQQFFRRIYDQWEDEREES